VSDVVSTDLPAQLTRVVGRDGELALRSTTDAVEPETARRISNAFAPWWLLTWSKSVDTQRERCGTCGLLWCARSVTL
jgi:hypothetical protein